MMNKPVRESIIPSETEALRQQRARLLFRSHHRGMKEMDVVLGRFAAATVARMSLSELAEYETILALPDPDLWEWVLGVTTPPPNVMSPLLQRLISFQAKSSEKI